MKQRQAKLTFLSSQSGGLQRNELWEAGNEGSIGGEILKKICVSETQRRQCKGENCFCGSSLLINIVINKTTCCTET